MTVLAYQEPPTAEPPAPALGDHPDFQTCVDYLTWLAAECPEALSRVASAPACNWCIESLANEYHSHCLVGHAIEASRNSRGDLHIGAREVFYTPQSSGVGPAWDRLCRAYGLPAARDAVQDYARDLFAARLTETEDALAGEWEPEDAPRCPSAARSRAGAPTPSRAGAPIAGMPSARALTRAWGCVMSETTGTTRKPLFDLEEYRLEFQRCNSGREFLAACHGPGEDVTPLQWASSLLSYLTQDGSPIDWTRVDDHEGLYAALDGAQRLVAGLEKAVRYAEGEATP